MAKDKKSFILYTDLISRTDHLTLEERGILFQHLLEYVNDLNPILEDRILIGVWKPIEQQLKRDLVKFEDVKAKRSDAGKRSAELRALKNEEQKTTNPTSVESVQQTSTNPTVNDSVNVNVNDSVNVIKENINTPLAFSFYNSLINYGFKKELVSDWLKVRKNKKLTNTETAYKKFIIEVEKCKLDKNKVLEECVSNSWGGFKFDWIKKEDPKYKQKKFSI